MESFDSKDILQNIVTGQNTDLYAILVEECELDSGSDVYNVISERLFFAGVTSEECRNYMEKKALALKPCAGEGYKLRACVVRDVTATGLSEFDTENGDADEIIDNFINIRMQEGLLEDIDDDWAFREVEYKYYSLQGCILVYWKWEAYVGYARRMLNMEYCIESGRTSNECVPIDSTSAIQTDCLLTADEIRKCRTIGEMAEMISKRLVGLGKWQNICDVDGFMQKLYKDKEEFPSIYSELPPINNI